MRTVEVKLDSLRLFLQKDDWNIWVNSSSSYYNMTFLRLIVTNHNFASYVKEKIQLKKFLIKVVSEIFLKIVYFTVIVLVCKFI